MSLVKDHDGPRQGERHRRANRWVLSSDGRTRTVKHDNGGMASRGKTSRVKGGRGTTWQRQGKSRRRSWQCLITLIRKSFPSFYILPSMLCYPVINSPIFCLRRCDIHLVHSFPKMKKDVQDGRVRRSKAEGRAADRARCAAARHGKARGSASPGETGNDAQAQKAAAMEAKA